MIKRSGTNSLLNKVFPLQSDFELLTTAQRRRLQIVWIGLAIFLAAVLFVALLLITSRTPDIIIPETANTSSAPTVKNAAPAQPLELKADQNASVNPDVAVIAGTVQTDSNNLNIKLQVAGKIVQDKTLPQVTVYQVGIDTDLDPSTGFQLNSDVIGAEYLADFDSKGNVVLLHWLQNQSRFESVSGLEVTQLNDNTLNFQVARAALGYPSQVNLVLLADDGGSVNQTFLPATGFVNYQLSSANQIAQTDAQPLWPYSFSTSQNGTTNKVELQQPANNALSPDFDMTYASISVDSTTLTATLKVAGRIENNSAPKPSVDYYQLLLDTDGNNQNDFANGRLGLGSEYLVDQDGNGFNSILAWDNDAATFNGVGGLQTQVNGNTLVFVLPLSSIGNPNSISFAFTAVDTRISQQNYFPDHSHATILTAFSVPTLTNAVQNATSDQALQLTSTNLQVSDGYLNATLQTANPVDVSNSSNSYYQLLIGKTITQSLTITDSTYTDTAALPANVLEPGLQVFYKLVFTPGQSVSQGQLYSWSDQTQAFGFVQTLPVSLSGSNISFQIPLSAIGGGLVGYYFQTYNPQDGFTQLLPQSQPKQFLIPGSGHQVLLASSTVTATNSLITQVTLDSKPTGVDFSVQASPNQAKTTNLTFWLDTDLDPTTGQQNLHAALGVDYMLKYNPTLDAAHIQIYSYDANQKTMKLLEVVPAQLDTANNRLNFELPYSPDTLSLASNFNMVVNASSAVANLTQLLPASSQDYARIYFQRQQDSQVLQAQPNSNSIMQQFALSYDGFYISGNLALSSINAKTNYTINIAAYTPALNSTTPKFDVNYYVINYDAQLNRATMHRWSDDNQDYEFMTQLDTTLDRQNNKIQFKFPYSLLGQPYYVNYIISAKTNSDVESLPAFNSGSSSTANDLFSVQQSSAIFYFKNSLQNPSFTMKQNAGQ